MDEQAMKESAGDRVNRGYYAYDAAGRLIGRLITPAHASPCSRASLAPIVTCGIVPQA